MVALASTPSKTAGEEVFETYLDCVSVPFEFEKEHRGKRKRPDYTIVWKEHTVVLDVKDFEPPTNIGTGPQSFDPYTRIREKIDQGRGKFSEFKEYPCGLVLYNRGDPFVQLSEDCIMLGAMYGDSGFTFPFNLHTGMGDSGQMKPAFLGRGKMIRPRRPTPQNTTISALITLDRIRPHFLTVLQMSHEFPDKDFWQLEEQAKRVIPNYDPGGEVTRVIVWHNAVARIPFPEDLFRGPYDSHMGVTVEKDGTFQRVTYRGELLPARLSL
jgi:hypothetical protein